MKINTSDIGSMFRRDAIVAGYGIVAGVWRKGMSKVLGSHIGETGTNILSVGVGTVMGQASNDHLNSIGGALRIGSLVRMGNNLVDGVLGSKKNNEETK